MASIRKLFTSCLNLVNLAYQFRLSAKVGVLSSSPLLSRQPLPPPAFSASLFLLPFHNLADPSPSPHAVCACLSRSLPTHFPACLSSSRSPCVCVPLSVSLLSPPALCLCVSLPLSSGELRCEGRARGIPTSAFEETTPGATGGNPRLCVCVLYPSRFDPIAPVDTIVSWIHFSPDTSHPRRRLSASLPNHTHTRTHAPTHTRTHRHRHAHTHIHTRTDTHAHTHALALPCAPWFAGAAEQEG